MNPVNTDRLLLWMIWMSAICSYYSIYAYIRNTHRKTKTTNPSVLCIFVIDVPCAIQLCLITTPMMHNPYFEEIVCFLVNSVNIPRVVRPSAALILIMFVRYIGSCSIRKDFYYLCRFNVGEWCKTQARIHTFSKQFAHNILNFE